MFRPRRPEHSLGIKARANVPPCRALPRVWVAPKDLRTHPEPATLYDSSYDLVSRPAFSTTVMELNPMAIAAAAGGTVPTAARLSAAML